EAQLIKGALEPDIRFHDPLNHICKRTESGTFHCNVHKKVDEWLSKAGEASGCQRYYLVGVASNYFFDSKNPFNLENFDVNRCTRPFEKNVEEHFIHQHSYNWSECACRVCVNYENFESWTSEFVKEVEFAIRGRDVIFLSNSIDLVLAKDFISYLEENEFNVSIVNASAFSDLKYKEKNIIILGGHRAPEGVGEIVSEILSESEKNFLVSIPTSQRLFSKRDVWAPAQAVWVFAGHEAPQTRLAWMEEKQRLLFGSPLPQISDECLNASECGEPYSSDFQCLTNDVIRLHYTPQCLKGECIFRSQKEILDHCLKGWYCQVGIDHCLKSNVTTGL
ncbi:MAG: hypothetical protein ABH950_03905, partial [Candidatus Altiarchaeota archaeon]